MSKDATEDHWKQRYEKLECQMEEMLARKDETIAKLEELLANAIGQRNVLTLERNNAKEAADAANVRNINAKAGKKKDDKNARNPKICTNESAGNAPPIYIGKRQRMPASAMRAERSSFRSTGRVYKDHNRG